MGFGAIKTTCYDTILILKHVKTLVLLTFRREYQPSRKASGGRPVGPQKLGVGGWERPVASAKKYFYIIIIENLQKQFDKLFEV